MIEETSKTKVKRRKMIYKKTFSLVPLIIFVALLTALKIRGLVA